MSGICQSLPASSNSLELMRILGRYICRLCPAGVSVAGWKKLSPHLRLVEAREVWADAGRWRGEERERGRGRVVEDAALSGPC